MSTAINELKKLYYADFEHALSTFKKCSYDSTAGLYLVSNETECLNFDFVKSALGFDCASCDSLYFSLPRDTILFVEFKNQPIRNAFENIGKSGCDSLYIHLVYSKKVGISVESIKHHYLAVIASNKNDSNKNSAVSAMIDRSSPNGSFDVSDYDFYCESAEKLSSDRMEREYGDVIEGKIKYDLFKIVLSDSFDTVVSLY